MRRAWWLILLAACGDRLVVPVGSGELGLPDAVQFPATALSFPREQAIPVVNRGRAPKTVTLSTAAPFSVPTAVLEVPGGAEVALSIAFTPVALGVAQGTLEVDGVSIPLEGLGVTAPECGAAGPCEVVRFDPNTVSCVRGAKANGTACEDALGCIEAGACEEGRCLGRAARCDDADACTTDACAVGRGCRHEAVECAASTTPCLAPRCDPRLGCTTSPVQDGTPCGAVSCELANVCLAGACRTVVPPEGFTCAPESACRGEGVCRAKQCVTPPQRDLKPRWTYTSNDGDLRFEGVTDAQGHWYWLECGAGAMPQPGHRCSAVSRTADGLERFRTDVTGPGVLRGTTSHTQLLADGRFIFVTNETTLVAVDATSGALVWQRTMTSLPSTGFRDIAELAEDGHGQLWTVVRSAQNRQRQDALVRLDASTGAVRGESIQQASLRGLVLDDAGRAFALRRPPDGLPGGFSALVRFEPDGSERFAVQLPIGQLPVMVLGDRVVLQDDSVRSAVDGRELEPPLTADWTAWQWTGVGADATSRVRVTQSTYDLLPSTIALHVTTRGQRLKAFEVVASRASDLYLTAGGEALFLTADEQGHASAATATHVRQVHPRGLELMSCNLVDEAFWRGGAEGPLGPLQFGRETGFNGRWLAVRSLPIDCPVCDADFWAPPRLAFYDLGRPGPGVGPRGWVGPRGTPGGSQRAR